jgi:hypothetical protein
MLNAIVVSIRFILLILAGQKQLALENARTAPAIVRVHTRRSAAKLNNRDRLFWIGLSMIGRSGKSALMIVQPETVTSWHRAVQTVLVDVIPTETSWPSGASANNCRR